MLFPYTCTIGKNLLEKVNSLQFYFETLGGSNNQTAGGKANKQGLGKGRKQALGRSEGGNISIII